MELEYQILEFLVCTKKKEKNRGKRPSLEESHVRGFQFELGFVGSLSSLWVLGFVAWVRRLGLLVCGFVG